MNSDNSDLFEQMEGKKIQQDKQDKQLLKVEKYGFDYYKVLGIDDKDTDIDTIKKKYRKLLAKYHPDKYKDSSDKEKAMKNKQYQLVQMAGKVLTDPDAKKMYDLEQKTIKSKNFQSQKNSFEDFIKLQESGITEESKKKATLEYKLEAEKLNKARGFDPSKQDDKLNKEDLKREMDDLRTRRDVDMIELKQKNMFEGRSFNPSEFNKIFEKDKKKREKVEKTKREKGELIRFGEEFTAFNDNGLDNFISIESDYSNPFGSDQFKENTLYGKLENEDFNLSDISSGEEEIGDMYNLHNANRDESSTNRRLDDLLKERESLNTSLKNIQTAGFKDVMEDQFGISRNFGKIIGKDITQKNNKQRLDSDMVKIYNKMITHDSDSDSD